MDRNRACILTILICTALSLSARRAWIEIRIYDMSAAWNRSLSARRAWIEISDRLCTYIQRYAALRKESVDRNFRLVYMLEGPVWSLSARRAWIEIFIPTGPKPCLGTSLSARRAWIEIVITAMTSQISVSRSPQGERG